MKLNQRLKTIGDLVDPNCKVLDVGCDHALLDIYLVQKNIGIEAIASDISDGPCTQAKKNIEAFGLQESIAVKMGDGLDSMEPGVTTVILSGMGGGTMKHILERGKTSLAQLDTILVSPNSEVAMLRSFLVQMNFFLTKEVMVQEHQMIYPVLKFERGHRHYSKRQLLFGPIFLKEKDPLVLAYYQKEWHKIQKILRQLPSRCVHRKWQLKRYAKKIEHLFFDS